MRRANLTLAWVAIMALFLAACGRNDAQQRTAFTEFLQTRIVDKPGVHVPKLTDEEKDSFGPYAEHYAVIADFNKAMDESVSPKLSAAMRAGSIRSLGDAVSQVDKLRAAKAGMNEMRAALGKQLAQADAARAKLEQPADLKPVYDKAYARLVSEPAAAFDGIAPVMDKVLGEAIELGQYIEQHRASVRVNGPFIETSDPAIQAAINQKLQSLQANQQAVQAAQERLRSVVYGGAR